MELPHLYDAMRPADLATGRPRGFALLGGGGQVAGAERNMAQLGGGGGRCPVSAIKREYCPVGERRGREALGEAPPLVVRAAGSASASAAHLSDLK